MKQRLIIFLIFSLTSTYAQEILWQKTIGGSANDRLTIIRQTFDKGYILVGTSSSGISGEKTEDTNGGDDFWIIKTDSVGSIQWQNTIGGSGTDELLSLEQTSDSGYIVGGNSDSPISGDKSDSSYGGKDYWIVKLDAGGNVQWNKTYGGTSTDELSSVFQTYDGGFFVAGFSASDSNGIKLEHKFGQNDFWVIKTDAFGIIQWQNTIGGDRTDVLRSALQTSDGGYVLFGNSSSSISGDKTEDSVGSGDFWIVKTDGLGNIQWQNTIGGTGYDFGQIVDQTSDGGFILGGISTSPVSGEKTTPNFSGSDLWIIKVDSTGNPQWQRNIGGTSADFMKSLIQTQDKGYLISGWGSNAIAGNKTVGGTGGNSFWILRLDSAGNDIWQSGIGGSDEDYSISSIEISPGEYMIGGYSNSNISEQKTEDSRGLFDYWMVRLTDNYNQITGNAFIDLNSNTIWDVGEPALRNHTIRETATGRIGTTRLDGSYSINLIDTGNFMVSPDSLRYFSPSPAQHLAHFTSSPQIDSLNDFALQTAIVVNDLQISVTRLTRFRPGFKGSYNIRYKNTGSVNLTPTITFKTDPLTIYDSSSVVPSSSTSDSVVWNFPSLAPFDEGDIYLRVSIDTAASINDTLTAFATIEPLTSDSFPQDNIDSCFAIVSGSFDPNEISVNRKNIFTTELATEYLEYTIFFQNTGNDTAFTVKINNPISDKIDASTFELLESSHAVIVNYQITDRSFWFEYHNILLPDSFINEPGSHGYVKYRIKALPTLSGGENILNKAYIYFDYNYAIITNSVNTNVLLLTNIESAKDHLAFSLYPNPTSGNIKIEFTLDHSSQVGFEIYNAQGVRVRTVELKKYTTGHHLTNIDASELSDGIYLVRFTMDSKQFTKRLIKM